jgi:hypothetical protein
MMAQLVRLAILVRLVKTHLSLGRLAKLVRLAILVQRAQLAKLGLQVILGKLELLDNLVLLAKLARLGWELLAQLVKLVLLGGRAKWASRVQREPLAKWGPLGSKGALA